MARRTTVMNIDLGGSEEINLVRDARDCKYDGDKATDNQQTQSGQSPLDPVVGKWKTNLVATTPIKSKAMKNMVC